MSVMLHASTPIPISLCPLSAGRELFGLQDYQLRSLSGLNDLNSNFFQIRKDLNLSSQMRDDITIKFHSHPTDLEVLLVI